MSWDVGDSGELIGNIIGVVLDIDAPPTGAAWGKSLRVRVSLDLVQPLQRGHRWSHWRKLPMVNLYGLHFNMNVCLHFATAVVVLGMGIESVIYGSRIKGPLSPTWLSLWSMASSPSCWQVAGGQSQWFIPLIND